MRRGGKTRGLRLGLTLLLVVVLTGCGADDPLGRRAISGVVKIDLQNLAQGNINFYPNATGGKIS